MRDELREKLKEKANAKIAEKSLLERKRFWLGLLVVATAVFGFAPAPENSGSKLVGVVQIGCFFVKMRKCFSIFARVFFRVFEVLF